MGFPNPSQKEATQDKRRKENVPGWLSIAITYAPICQLLRAGNKRLLSQMTFFYHIEREDFVKPFNPN